jgi:hypothetical protein
LGRREFLVSTAAGAAGLVAGATAVAQTAAAAAPPATVPPATVPPATVPPATASPSIEAYSTERPGADFMVDVLKSLEFDYVCANPGSSFRGLHESLVNYGGNSRPELITCCHEESSVAMAHGYAKIEGKPLLVMAHGTVGLQHASMAIYNAYADRVPVYILLGNIQDATWRRGDDGARLHQMGRQSRLARPLRRIRGARLQGGAHAAL